MKNLNELKLDIDDLVEGVYSLADYALAGNRATAKYDFMEVAFRAVKLLRLELEDAKNLSRRLRQANDDLQERLQIMEETHGSFYEEKEVQNDPR
jgi:hypothetical protein